ncbi:MAG: histidine phosphatase family protein [Desulfobacterales bacterium]|nr:histidine phosphatase family protein [Desulfobacterales bacterium]
MALYLVQHGRSLPKEIDPDQGLSPEGIAETERTARLAAELGLKIGGILQSGKTRARQTAEILAAGASSPWRHQGGLRA